MTKSTADPTLSEDESSLINKLAVQSLDKVVSAVNTLFPNEYTIANIFKNKQKCRLLADFLVG